MKVFIFGVPNARLDLVRFGLDDRCRGRSLGVRSDRVVTEGERVTSSRSETDSEVVLVPVIDVREVAFVDWNQIYLTLHPFGCVFVRLCLPVKKSLAG